MKYIILLIPLLLLSSCDGNITNTNSGNIISSCDDRSGNSCTFEQVCNSPDSMYQIKSNTGILLSFAYSKSGNFIYSFRDTADQFKIFNEKSIEKVRNNKKGYRFSFWGYDCITKKEKLLVSEETAGHILDLLPTNSDLLYYPDVLGWDVFENENYSFFDNILRFQYRQGYDIGGPQGFYKIVLNTGTHSIWIDGFFDKNDGSNDKKIYFSTGQTDSFY